MDCRACLKDVPDNLIFHLKRFDFNLRTLQRSKINDYFSFPRKLDMRPYKVEHLTESSNEAPEDVFELVGILVHSGTAESGHYYSYIKERPNAMGQDSWVEFNDDNVSSFDPEMIESTCFGGADLRGQLDNNSLHFDKAWSAYMLFYQRSSSLRVQQESLASTDQIGPVRLPLDVAFNNHIAADGEITMRRFSLYDPEHIPFVLRTLENLKHLNRNSCTAEHKLEDKVLTMVFNHFDQVVARTKDTPHLMNYVQHMKESLRGCVFCSACFLDWISRSPEILRHQLMRTPETLVRQNFADMLFQTLNKVKQENAVAYGYSEDDSECSDVEDRHFNLFVRLLEALTINFANFPHCTRAWPEYFGLLEAMASGHFEKICFLEHSFLEKLLYMIVADQSIDMEPMYQRLLNILAKRIPGRVICWDQVVGLLDKLLQVSDMNHVRRNNRSLTYCEDFNRLPVTRTESDLFNWIWQSRPPVRMLLVKLLRLNSNPHATQSIIRKVIESSDEPDTAVTATIRSGIRSGSIPLESYLAAATTYCQTTSDLDEVLAMIKTVLGATPIHAYIDGQAFFKFYRDLQDLSAKDGQNEQELESYKLSILQFWAPKLLIHSDLTVRADTENFVRDFLFRRELEVAAASEEESENNAYTEMIRQLGLECLSLLNETYVRPRISALRVQVTNILRVVELCTPFYGNEPEDNLDEQFHNWCHCELFCTPSTRPILTTFQPLLTHSRDSLSMRLMMLALVSRSDFQKPCQTLTLIVSWDEESQLSESDNMAEIEASLGPEIDEIAVDI
jgi:ubiquitin carboxyl-terminal hydrolase 34